MVITKSKRETEDVRDSLERAVAAIPAKKMVQLRFDPLDAKRAVNEGLSVLHRHSAVMMTDFPGFKRAGLHELPEACERLRDVQRQLQVMLKRRGSGPVPLALSWRRKLLNLARTLRELGEVRADQLAKIEVGRGQSDNLQDVVSLVALLKPHQKKVSAVLGKDALNLALGTAQRALEGQGAARVDTSLLALRRDRLATLIMQRHDRLRAAVAAVTTMREAMLLVPPLSTGRRSARRPA